MVQNIKQSLQNKLNFTQSYEQTDSLIENTANITANKLRKFNLENPSVKQSPKKNQGLDKSKLIAEKLEEMRIFYEKLKSIINDISPQFYLTPQFQKFKNLHEKSIDLKATNLDREVRIQILTRSLEAKKKNLEVYYKINLNFNL